MSEVRCRAGGVVGAERGSRRSCRGFRQLQELTKMLQDCFATFRWITGLIFLLIDKRSFVKFHAAQYIAFNIVHVPSWFAFWFLVVVIIAITYAIFHFPFGFLTFSLLPVWELPSLRTWIFLMFKAYNHEKFKLPIIGDIVDKMVNK